MRRNALGLVPDAITLPRALDLNDRSLRDVLVGTSEKGEGYPRRARFEIAAATNVADLRARLGRIVVGPTRNGRLATAEDLRGAGAMTALLLHTIDPNLLSTLEGTPVIVHTGPFANLAHGNSSVIADLVAKRL